MLHCCLCLFLSQRSTFGIVMSLTTAAFIATLWRFIGRWGKPSVIWSDHGTNFVRTARELKPLRENLETRQAISDYSSNQGIRWKFIPEQSPHFSGLWEAAVKSFKFHLKTIIGDVKVNLEDLTTITIQIEACLNSRQLAPLPENTDEIEALTPGHFIIRLPLEALPDPSSSHRPMTESKYWNFCQMLVQHFWQWWSSEYLGQLQRFSKWNTPSRNVQVDDVVCLRDGHMIPTKWLLTYVTAVHPGADGKVRVVTV